MSHFQDGQTQKKQGRILKAIDLCPGRPADDGLFLKWDNASFSWVLAAPASGGLIKTPNTKNCKRSRKTANQTIKTLTFSDITDLDVGNVNQNQLVGIVIGFVKNISGTCQFRAIGVTSATVYWTSPNYGNTGVGSVSAIFPMTGAAEHVKLQALSSEVTNGVNVNGGGTATGGASCIMCGDIILGVNTAGIVNATIQFQATSIDYCVGADLELAATSVPTMTVIEGIGAQSIGLTGVTPVIDTTSFPIEAYFQGISASFPSTTKILCAISFTGNWLNN